MEENQAKKAIEAIQKTLSSSNERIFSYAWREKLGEMGEFLEQESRYCKLVNWIDHRLDCEIKTIGVFCPCDKDENYTMAYLNTYLESMQTVGVLTQLKELLLDSRSTTKMRENIEYTLCKLYNLEYSEQFKDYIHRSE